MSEDLDRPAFRRGAVRPVECVREGWRLIRRDYWQFFGISVVGLLLGSAVPMNILLGPMMCGIYLCLLRKMDGRRVSFDMLFRGFDHFVQSLIATLVVTVPVLVLLVPAYAGFIAVIITNSPGPRGGGAAPAPPASDLMIPLAFACFFAWVMIISTAVGALFVFTYPLIVDRGLSGMAAAGTSVRAVLGNLGGVLGLMSWSWGWGSSGCWPVTSARSS